MPAALAYGCGITGRARSIATLIAVDSTPPVTIAATVNAAAVTSRRTSSTTASTTASSRQVSGPAANVATFSPYTQPGWPAANELARSAIERSSSTSGPQPVATSAVSATNAAVATAATRTSARLTPRTLTRTPSGGRVCRPGLGEQPPDVLRLRRFEPAEDHQSLLPVPPRIAILAQLAAGQTKAAQPVGLVPGVAVLPGDGQAALETRDRLAVPA